MNHIVLCVENGNPYFDETKKFLCCQGCKVYRLSEQQKIEMMIAEIERKEGRLDILLLGVAAGTLQDGPIGENMIAEGFWRH